MHQGEGRRKFALVATTLTVGASLLSLAACRDVYLYPLRDSSGGAGGGGVALGGQSGDGGGGGLGGQSGAAGGGRGGLGGQQPVTCPASKLIGFGALGGAPTTGGGTGLPVVVHTAAELKMAGMTSGPSIIRISGTITLTDQVDIGSDKTVEGDGGALSGLTGAGLRVKEAHNVIFRNLVISKAAGTEGDAIHLQTAVNVWIDHCDLSSELDNEGTYDGLVDISHACDDITVSWTRFHDHHHACLVGHSEDNATEDTGHLTVTFYGNLFDNVESELPRVRFGKAHVFNNHFRKVGLFAIASQMGADVLVERNVFESVAIPMQTHYEDRMDGFIRASENLVDAASGSSIFTTEESTWIPPYSYAGGLLPMDRVALVVDACAGVSNP